MAFQVFTPKETLFLCRAEEEGEISRIIGLVIDEDETIIVNGEERNLFNMYAITYDGVFLVGDNEYIQEKLTRDSWLYNKMKTDHDSAYGDVEDFELYCKLAGVPIVDPE